MSASLRTTVIHQIIALGCQPKLDTSPCTNAVFIYSNSFLTLSKASAIPPCIGYYSRTRLIF